MSENGKQENSDKPTGYTPPEKGTIEQFADSFGDVYREGGISKLALHILIVLLIGALVVGCAGLMLYGACAMCGGGGGGGGGCGCGDDWAYCDPAKEDCQRKVDKKYEETLRGPQGCTK